MISKSFADVFRPELRKVLWRSIAIALMVLFAIWFGLQKLAGVSIELSYSWLDWGLTLLASLAILAVAIYMVPTTTALVAGIFLDDIAQDVERLHYGEANVGKAMDLTAGLINAVRFGALVLGLNLIAFMLLLVPGINAIIFLVLNGYLFGREYFELAVLRHVGKLKAKSLRQRYGFRLFVLGLVIAAYLAIPILNLTTPLFATALMVHFVADLRNKSAFENALPLQIKG